MKNRLAAGRPGVHHTGEESHLLREVMRTQQAVVATLARSIGAPASRLGLMRLLAVSEGELGPVELAHRLGVHPAAVTRQLERMEAEGLVIRRADPTDGRRCTARLTRPGVEAFRGIHERGHALERELEREVSSRDVDVAVRVLQAMRRVVLRAANGHGEEQP